MKINTGTVIALVLLLAIAYWVFSTAEFSNTQFSNEDYVEPIKDQSGGSLSGSNLVLMDPVSGNMKLAPVDTFNTNTQTNLDKVVSEKVPGQIAAADREIRGKPDQAQYTNTMRDLHNGLLKRYTKTESNDRYYTQGQTDNKYIKYNDDVYIQIQGNHSGAKGKTGKYLNASRHHAQAKWDGQISMSNNPKWRLLYAGGFNFGNQNLA